MSIRQLVDPIIDLYIEHFADYNGSVRNETLKWSAAERFKEHWNIDAEDLHGTWKASLNKSFIDTQHASPWTGIEKLLSKPEEVEYVREEFRKLFQEDEDPDRKLSQIDAFIEQINAHIDLHEDISKHSYQDRPSVLTYMNLNSPDTNYRYKPDPANEWAAYTEVGDWTTGADFSLAKYYRMCDELLEIVKSREDLLALHNRRFEKGLKNYDQELHILTFDVLYCSWGLKSPMKAVKTKAKDELRRGRIREQIEALEEEKKPYQDLIRETRASMQVVEIKELPMTHKKFGPGVATVEEPDHLVVVLADGTRKKFKYPDAVAGGLIIPDDPEIAQILSENCRLEEEIRKAKKAIKKLDEQEAELQKELT